MINGGAGDFCFSPRLTPDTVKGCACTAFMTSSTSSLDLSSCFLSPLPWKRAVNHGVLRAAVETRVEQPVLLALERLDLLLAVNDHARGDGLHTSRGQPFLYLAPEQRGELIADDAVEYAPRLLGIDKVLVDAARVLDALGDDLFW